jgi:hypothetical protein
LSDGESWPVDLYLDFKETAVVKLYDNDTGNDDFLGSYTYTPSQAQPETVPISNTNGAEYQLTTEPNAAQG